MKLPSNQDLYEASVQDPAAEIDQFERMFRQCAGYRPLFFREDFCSSFALSVEWVRRGRKRIAHAVDRDPKILSFGRKKHFPLLTPTERKRIFLHEGNVLKVATPKVDLIASSNFAVFYLKTRSDLVQYFQKSFQRLRRGGMFSVDLLGGIEQQSTNVTRTKMKIGHLSYTYVWEQVSFNPINSEGIFHIHFEFPDGSKRKRAFTYDWRIWSIQEIREAMKEVGFQKTYVYWERDDGKGSGNGEFYRTEKEENCESWLAYVVGCKLNSPG